MKKLKKTLLLWLKNFQLWIVEVDIYNTKLHSDEYSLMDYTENIKRLKHRRLKIIKKIKECQNL